MGEYGRVELPYLNPLFRQVLMRILQITAYLVNYDLIRTCRQIIGNTEVFFTFYGLMYQFRWIKTWQSVSLLSFNITKNRLGTDSRANTRVDSRADPRADPRNDPRND